MREMDLQTPPISWSRSDRVSSSTPRRTNLSGGKSRWRSLKGSGRCDEKVQLANQIYDLVTVTCGTGPGAGQV
ncbi:hypothetical protein INR49_008848 [Caranx melampygus]|nr:hypothetical protein INR49_008848 [Caranx melampygus]